MYPNSSLVVGSYSSWLGIIHSKLAIGQIIQDNFFIYILFSSILSHSKFHDCLLLLSFENGILPMYICNRKEWLINFPSVCCYYLLESERVKLNRCLSMDFFTFSWCTIFVCLIVLIIWFSLTSHDLLISQKANYGRFCALIELRIQKENYVTDVVTVYLTIGNWGWGLGF